MNWDAIKHIYRNVLIDGIKIKYLGEDKYVLTQYHSNGEIYRKIKIKNGKRHGKSNAWYEDGTKEWEVHYKNGIPHGKYIIWWANGVEQYNGMYHNGKLTRTKDKL
ncbi:hypothetical protein LCGC14_2877360 [marine sediment metagenome]|uniref:Uncharacterized protein n=1 Tax=marine sediment metagenome TaxID=412755 RepID=A0A0F9A980_9ZZZZ